MKVTLKELNEAYEKANEYKLEGYPIANEIFIELDRNPLTDKNYFDEDSDFVVVQKLRFIFDKSLGLNGSYVLDTEVEVIDIDVDEEVN